MGLNLLPTPKPCAFPQGCSAWWQGQEGHEQHKACRLGRQPQLQRSNEDSCPSYINSFWQTIFCLSSSHLWSGDDDSVLFITVICAALSVIILQGFLFTANYPTLRGKLRHRATLIAKCHPVGQSRSSQFYIIL